MIGVGVLTDFTDRQTAGLAFTALVTAVAAVGAVLIVARTQESTHPDNTNQEQV